MENYEAMNTEFGEVQLKGLQVALSEQASATNYGTEGGVRYQAYAVDRADNDYQVIWDTVEDWSIWSEDESNACDWDNPISIERL